MKRYRIVLWDDNTYTAQKFYIPLGWVNITSHTREEVARAALEMYLHEDRPRKIRRVLT